MLGLSESTVWRRINDGSLPSYQPGGPGTAMRLPIEALTTKTQQPAAGPQETTPPPMETPPLRRGPRPRWENILEDASHN